MLKKALQAMIFSVMPQRLQSKVAEKKVGGDNITKLAIYPPGFDIEDMDISKTIAFIPYCCKPQGCPANNGYSRKNKLCYLKLGEQCDYGETCDVGRWINLLHYHGIKSRQIMIIDSDENLFDWLRSKYTAGYKYTIGFGCTFAVLYAVDYVFGQLGYKGIIGYIQGETCTDLKDYLSMEHSDKGKQANLDTAQLSELDSMLYVARFKPNRQEQNRSSACSCRIKNARRW